MATFRAEPTRLVAAPAEGAMALVSSLAALLAPPIAVLWVLHTTRIGRDLGRHQSPPLSLPEVRDLLGEFAGFFENDARSDLWLHSRAPEATIVYERHGLIYVYGPLDAARAVLEAAGLREGPVAIPSLHEHHYRAEYDEAERALASRYDWTITPLRAEDEQIPTV